MRLAGLGKSGGPFLHPGMKLEPGNDRNDHGCHLLTLILNSLKTLPLSFPHTPHSALPHEKILLFVPIFVPFPATLLRQLFIVST